MIWSLMLVLNLTPFFSIRQYRAEIRSAAAMDAEAASIEAETERMEAENATMLIAMQDGGGE